MEDKKKELIKKISKLMFIHKQTSHYAQSKKDEFSINIYKRKRSKSAVFTLQRNERLHKKPIKKVWISMEYKYQQTKIKPGNFEELRQYIETNGIDEDLNYMYLEYLKKNEENNFLKEFEQYKYTISFKKRMKLSKTPEEEINVSLRDYFQDILLLIVKEPSKFDVDKVLKKFNVDFEKFGILINQNTNIELFYCFLLCKFLNIYKSLKEKDYEPEYYISFLKEFIEQKDLTPIKCLILVWIIFSLDNDKDDFQFYQALKTYNLILKKDKNNELFYKGKISKKSFIYNFQKIIDDNKLFIDNCYFGKHFKYIYQFFQDVIRSPLLTQIYSNMIGDSSILQKYNYEDINAKKIILFPMLINGIDFGFSQNYLGIILVNSLPYIKNINNNSSSNVLFNIYNYFCFYVTILHEQGFNYLRFIFNKLGYSIVDNTPEYLFLNLTKDKNKLDLLKNDYDVGDRGETIIFGKKELTLKQILYFSKLANYSKTLSLIEKEISELGYVENIVEDDINNSFFKDILTNEEKDNLYKGIYDKEMANHLPIKFKKGKSFSIPFFYGKDKIMMKKSSKIN